MSDDEFRNDLIEIIIKNEPELEQRFRKHVYGCQETGTCFSDSIQAVCADWCANRPEGWEVFTDEHKVNLISKAARFKGLDSYKKCGECNGKYAQIEESHYQVTSFQSPYENRELIEVTHLIVLAEKMEDKRDRLTFDEKRVLFLILQDKDLLEIAESIGKTYRAVQKIRERAIAKLIKIAKSEKGEENQK